MSIDSNSSDGLIHSSTAQSGDRLFRVYVAAATAPDETPRVTAVITALVARGFVVTCTWPVVVARTGCGNPRDASALERRDLSIRCLAEIDASDAVLFLVPDPPATTCGGWWEASYAHENDKHLVFSGDTLQSVFCSLGHEFHSDEAAIAHLVRIRDRARVEAGLRELAANARPRDAAGGLAQRMQEIGETVAAHQRALDELRHAVEAQGAPPTMPRTRAIEIVSTDGEKR